LKGCKRCFREFEESEADTVDVSPTTELADYVDSRFTGMTKKIEGTTEGRLISVLKI